MATYKEVMAVLGKFYSLKDEVIQNQLRGRIQNFQRLGVPIGLQVGKGKRIDYGRNEIYQLVFCLELAEVGLLPAAIAKIVRESWESFYWNEFKKALNGRPMKLYFKLNLMSAEWDKERATVPPVEEMDLQIRDGESKDEALKRWISEYLGPVMKEGQKKHAVELFMASNFDSWEPSAFGFRHFSIVDVSVIVRDVEKLLVGILPPYKPEPDAK
jgi:hypothetical protein